MTCLPTLIPATFQGHFLVSIFSGQGIKSSNVFSNVSLLCSDEAMHVDSPVLAVELDVEEMTSQS
jgi:hypothetical protein